MFAERGKHEDNDDILTVRSSPEVKRFLLFIDDCILADEIDDSELEDIMVQFPRKKKPLLHLLLSALVDDVDIKTAFNSGENRSLFSSLLGIVNGDDRLVNKELYWDLITKLNLFEESLCMIMANPWTTFGLETVTHFMNEIFGRRVSNLLEVCDLLLIVLVKILRLVDLEEGPSQEFGREYLDCFNQLCSFTLYQSNKFRERHLTFNLVFNCTALCLIEDNDLKEDKQFAALAKEWHFIPEPFNAKSLKTYELLFNSDFKTKTATFRENMMYFLNRYFPPLVLYVEEELRQEWDGVVGNGRKVSRLDFVSAYSHFIRILFEKRSSLNGLDLMNEYSALGNFLNFLSKYKPKLTDEELISEEIPFHKFFVILNRKTQNGEEFELDREVKTIWINKFLSFQSRDIMEEQEYLDAAWTLLEQADEETLIRFIQTVCQCYSQSEELDSDLEEAETEVDLNSIECDLEPERGPVNDVVEPGLEPGHEDDNVMERDTNSEDLRLELGNGMKILILKMLVDSWQGGEIKEEVITAIFQDQIWDKFQLPKYREQVNTLVQQVNSIELEMEKSEKLVQLHRSVIKLCYQNPPDVLRKLLDRSIRIENFRALEFIQPFFKLKTFKRKPQQIETENEPESITLIGASLAKLLDLHREYPSELYNSVGKCMPYLLRKDYFTVEELFSLLWDKIWGHLHHGNNLYLGAVLGGIYLLECFVKCVVEEKFDGADTSLKIVLEHVFKLKKFFYSFTTPVTFVLAMQIRDKLVSIVKYLKDQGYSVFPSMEEDIARILREGEKPTLVDLGLTFMRYEELRPEVLKIFKEDENVKEVVSKVDLESVHVILHHWVTNSSEAEWESLIQLLFKEGVITSNQKIQNVGNVHLLTKFLMVSYVMVVTGDFTESPRFDVFAHILRFYANAMSYLENEKKILERQDDWYQLLKSLAALAIVIGKTKTITTLKPFDQSQKEKETKGKIKDTKYFKGNSTSISVILHKLLTYLLKQVEEFEKIGGINSSSATKELIRLVSLIRNVDSNCSGVRWLILRKLGWEEKENCQDGGKIPGGGGPTPSSSSAKQA